MNKKQQIPTIRRPEDRRPCHTTSFIAGLAYTAKNVHIFTLAISDLIAHARPIRGQAPN